MMIIIDQKIKLDDLLHFYEGCYRFLDISYFSWIEIIKTRQRERRSTSSIENLTSFMLCLFIFVASAKCTHRKKGSNLLISSALYIKHFEIEHK